MGNKKEKNKTAPKKAKKKPNIQKIIIYTMLIAILASGIFGTLASFM